MANFFAELKRRHIYRVAAAYAVVAWVLVQLVNNLAPIFELPPWMARAVVLLLIVGFPITLLIAWMRELAPADGSTARAVTGKLDWLLIGALAIVLAGLSYQQLAPTRTAQQLALSQATVTAEQSGVQAARQAAASPAGAISIAVLPFGNLSGDTGQEFFSDGMTEEITAALAKVPDLQVVARASAFQFKGEKKDMRAVGQALGARYLIDGSVRKAGNRVRITAQLIRADNGVNVWTDNYDRELTDIFATQEDIAQAIAAALRVPLGLRQGEALVRDRTKDLESYDQYLRAKALERAGGFDRLTEAVKLLEQVVARDPGFAPGWALLAQAYNNLPGNNPEVTSGSLEEARRVAQSLLDKGEKAARETIRLDSRSAVGYAALARNQARRGNRVTSEDLFKEALALDSYEPEVLVNYVTQLAVTGRLKEALSLSEKLRTLEPFVPVYSFAAARIMQLNGQNEASIPLLEAIPPGGAASYNRNSSLAMAQAAAGRYAEAADTLLAMSREQSSVSRRSIEDAARLLRSAPAKVRSPDALPVLEGELRFVYAYVGASDRVLEYSERGREIQAGISQSIWLPLYAPLRKTERFKAVVRKAGLVDYWRAKGWPDLCHPVGTDDFACD